MDLFCVPKKVNRHVMKAMRDLSSNRPNTPVKLASLLNQVKFQMRNLVPVANVNRTINKSLKNLTDMGFLELHSYNRYKLSSAAMMAIAPPAKRVRVQRQNKCFQRVPNQNEKSKLNPNRKREQDSDDSLSGDEIERTRKRYRPGKTLKKAGQRAIIPHARRGRAKAPRDEPAFQCGNAMRMGLYRWSVNNPDTNFNVSDYVLNLRNELEMQRSRTPCSSDETINSREMNKQIHSIAHVRRIVHTPSPHPSQIDSKFRSVTPHLNGTVATQTVVSILPSRRNSDFLRTDVVGLQMLDPSVEDLGMGIMPGIIDSTEQNVADMPMLPPGFDCPHALPNVDVYPNGPNEDDDDDDDEMFSFARRTPRHFYN